MSITDDPIELADYEIECALQSIAQELSESDDVATSVVGDLAQATLDSDSKLTRRQGALYLIYFMHLRMSGSK